MSIRKLFLFLVGHLLNFTMNVAQGPVTYSTKPVKVQEIDVCVYGAKTINATGIDGVVTADALLLMPDRK